MRPKHIITIIVLLIVIVIVLAGSLFTVDETRQAIITQLGKYVRTVSEPGLHLKIPLIQRVERFEDRVLEYDAAAAPIITSVLENRAQIMENIHDECNRKAAEYGIEVIDVRIKRADLPGEVAHSVYARMKAERQRIAKQYRSEGEEKAVKIRATTDKEKTILLAESYRKAQKLRGEGDAEAIKIFAQAFEKDPEFFAFVKTLEAYEKSLRSNTTIILRSDSEFFRYLSPPKK